MSQTKVEIPDEIEMESVVIQNPAAYEDSTVDGANKANGDVASQTVSAEFKLNRDPRHKVWQLITFFRRVFIYFVVVILSNTNKLHLPSWGRLIFKCLPVFTLSVFIYQQFNSFRLLWNNRYAFLIFVGITFSYIADGLLVYQEINTGYFLAGLIVFAIAHVFYTVAFGWRPFQSRMLLRSLIASALVYYYLYISNLQKQGMGLVIGVAIYILIIFAMQWRAWARVSFRDILEGRYYEIFGALGASFFALSDAILGVNKFSFPVPGSDYSIQVFYYLGQVLIALSVLDGPNIDWSNEQLIELDGSESKPSKIKQYFKRILHWLIS